MKKPSYQDKIDALKDPVIQRILPRYIKIVNNELWANFQIAKRIVFDFEKSLDTSQLWEEHSNLMKKFQETKEFLDKKKLALKELEIPRYSLLDLKILLAKDMLKRCDLCEWNCNANRQEGRLGFCKVGNSCKISSECVNTSEESFYIPSHTIFFWSCNMQCVFCQNFTISQRFEDGKIVLPRQLARIIELRKEEGCINCNLVGGESTMSLPWILETLKYVRVNTPILWNSNMFMSEKTMKILEGITDVYLTDFKFGPGDCSERLAKVKKYWDVATRNHMIAAFQTETTIRHLIIPGHVGCCSIPILEWIENFIKDKCLVNIMDQYYPYYLAKQYSDINRKITEEEYQKVLKKAKELNLNVRS